MDDPLTASSIEWTFEPFEQKPHDLFFLTRGNTKVFGRKRPVSIDPGRNSPARKCCLIDCSMLLGFAEREQVLEQGVAVFYRPFTPVVREEVFDDLASDPLTELYFPFPDLDAEARRERCSARDFWNHSAERIRELDDDEQPIREVTTEFLASFDMHEKVLFDPACSTGTFLRAIQSRYPSVRTVGQDLSEPMVQRCAQFLDEVHHGDSAQPCIPEKSADFLFLRFLNFHVVSTADAHLLFL